MVTKKSAKPPFRAIRFPDLAARKGINFSRMHVDRLEKAGKFPKRFNLGANSVAWDEEEVDAWLAARRDTREHAAA